MATSQSKFRRSFDEEFKREVAALASRPGAEQEQVARDLGVNPYSVSRWKKLYGGSEPALSTAAPGARQRPGTRAAHPCAGARVCRPA